MTLEEQLNCGDVRIQQIQLDRLADQYPVPKFTVGFLVDNLPLPLRRFLRVALNRVLSLPITPRFFSTKNTSAITETESQLVTAAIISFFSDGYDVVRHQVWPLVFAAIWGNDLATYYMNDRYHTSLSDLFSARSTNHDPLHSSVLSNFGSDIPFEPEYYLFAIPYFLAFSAGLINLICQRQTLSAYRNAYLSLPDYSSVVNVAKIKMEFLSVDDATDRDDLIQKIAIDFIANQSLTFMQKCHLVLALRAIASSGIDQQIPPLNDVRTSFAKQAYKKLIKISHDDIYESNKLLRLYARYHLWKLGGPVNFQYKPFFFTLLAWQLAATAQWWWLPIKKVWGIVDFLQQKSACENQQKVWHFIPFQGNYNCTACDWPMVDYTSSLTGQGCLNRLLSFPQDPKYFFENEKLSYLNKGDNYHVLNLANQNWFEWQSSDWQKVLTNFSQLGNNSFQAVNVSVVSSAKPISFDHIQTLANFLAKQPLRALDISHLKLNEETAPVLFNSLTNLPIEELTADEATISSDACAALMNVTQHFLNLTHLSIVNNNCDGSAMSLLLDLNHTNIQYLNLAANPLIVDNLQNLTDIIAANPVVHLDISGIAWFSSSPFNFRNVISNKVTIQYLGSQHASLTDDTFAEISENLFSINRQCHFNFANNNLGHCNLGDLLNITLANRTHWDFSFDFSNNDITFSQLIPLADALKKTQGIVLKNSHFSDDALTLFLQNLVPNSDWQALDLSDNDFSHNMTDFFLQQLSSANKTFLSLTLNNARLSDADVGKLMRYAFSHELHSLSLSNNNALNIDLLSDIQKLNYLRYLDLSHNNISQVDLTLMDANASLATLKLDHNPLTVSFGKEVSRLMISPELSAQTLSANFDEDFSRQLSSEVVSDSRITELSLLGTGIDDGSIESLCRVWAMTGREIEVLNLPALSDYTENHLLGCPAVAPVVSLSSRLRPPLLYRLLTKLIYTERRNDAKQVTSTELAIYKPNQMTVSYVDITSIVRVGLIAFTLSLILKLLNQNKNPFKFLLFFPVVCLLFAQASFVSIALMGMQTVSQSLCNSSNLPSFVSEGASFLLQLSAMQMLQDESSELTLASCVVMLLAAKLGAVAAEKTCQLVSHRDHLFSDGKSSSSSNFTSNSFSGSSL